MAIDLSQKPGLSLFSTLEDAPIVSPSRHRDLPFFFSPSGISDFHRSNLQLLYLPNI